MTAFIWLPQYSHVKCFEIMCVEYVCRSSFNANISHLQMCKGVIQIYRVENKTTRKRNELNKKAKKMLLGCHKSSHGGMRSCVHVPVRWTNN